MNRNQLTHAWRALVFRVPPGILRVGGGPGLVGDGIKIAKAGRKMPGVKKLHQTSESNTKPEYIFGHSCQAVAVLTRAWLSVFALPLACRIHEGVVFSNRDRRTLLDKMILLLDSLRSLLGSAGIEEPFYFVADAYYATGKIVRGLLAKGNHLAPLEIIRLYGLRFKIEVSFKQSLRGIGAYAYHFWMKAMTPLRRVSGNQHLHRKTEAYRDGVRRKIAAYHRHIQLGLIAQGLLQILSATMSKSIWRSFGSWIRTIRPGLAPSEPVAAIALRNTLPE